MKIIVPCVCGTLIIACLMLYWSSPAYQIRDLQAENRSLREQLALNTNNPAELAAVCLAGSSALVALVFFGIYGLLYFQAVIRRAEADQGGQYLPQGTVRQSVCCPDSAKSLPEYSHDDRAYAVQTYQGY